MATFDWAAFESALCEEFVVALRRVGEQHRTLRFYAVALYGVYAEEDGVLSLPCLGAATEEKGPARDDRGFWGARFSPADWDLPEIALRRATTSRLERALTDEATRGSVEHWRRVEARYSRVLLRIIRRLRDDAPALLPVTREFICFWHDGVGGVELACQTIPRALFERLFTRQIDDDRQRREAVAMPEDERAKYLVGRLDKFEGVTREDAEGLLVEMGERAIPALLDVLSDAALGWNAASLLGQIGLSTPAVVDALRARAQSDWHARALGMLGDHAWLAAQTPSIAVNGLTARLKEITGGGLLWPLDLRPLEGWLDAAGEPARVLAEEELKPGVSPMRIQRTAIGEALRGLHSRHAVVRWHAASVLGDRVLGVAAGRKIIAALASALQDPHPVVRRVALVSIAEWKGAASPYRQAMRRMLDDPDEIVRRVAQQATSDSR